MAPWSPRRRESSDVAPRPTTSALRRRARALWWRGRLVVAALCCGVAASLIVSAARPAPPPTAAVVVVARSVPAGATLTGQDLRVDHVPTQLVPEGAATRADDVTGRRASVALTPGTLVQGSLVAAGELAASAPDGTVVAPVRLDPGVAALLAAGDRVDLLVAPDGIASGAGQAEPLDPAAVTSPDPATIPAHDPYLARSAVVVPSPEPSDGGGLLGTGGSGTDTVTLVAVRPEEAVRLASVTGWATITAVLVP
jgi:pilus assembly protein CpaB